MPPRKRTKVTSAPDATSPQPKTPASARSSHHPSHASTPREHEPDDKNKEFTNDPWTDEQEMCLLKGVVRWKPTGIHKHFHMLSIYRSMLSHNLASPAAEHTRIPGIWDKLGSLYDLAALDEREEAFAANGTLEDEPVEEDDGGVFSNEASRDFALPDDDDDDDEYGHDTIEPFDRADCGKRFADIIWKQRFNSEGASSPPALLPEAYFGESDPPPKRLSPSLVSELDEQASKKGPRPGTTKGRGRGAPSRTHEQKATRRGRKGSKAASPAASEQVEASEEAEEDDAAEESEEGDDGTAVKSSPAGHGPRGRPRGGRARPVMGSRRSTRRK